MLLRTFFYRSRHASLFCITRRLPRIRISPKSIALPQDHNFGFGLLFHDSFGRCIRFRTVFCRSRHAPLFSLTRRLPRIRISSGSIAFPHDHSFGFRPFFHDSFDRYIKFVTVFCQARHALLFSLTRRFPNIRIPSGSIAFPRDHSFGFRLLFHDSFDRCILFQITFYHSRQTSLFWITRRLHGIRVSSKLIVFPQGHSFEFRSLFHDSSGQCI